MASKTSAPTPKAGRYDGSKSYSPQPREATPTQVSAGGLVLRGQDGETGTGGGQQ